MKAFIILAKYSNWEDSGSYIAGVYDTREKAKAYLETDKEGLMDNFRNSKYEIEFDDSYFAITSSDEYYEREIIETEVL